MLRVAWFVVVYAAEPSFANSARRIHRFETCPVLAAEGAVLIAGVSSHGCFPPRCFIYGKQKSPAFCWALLLRVVYMITGFYHANIIHRYYVVIKWLLSEKLGRFLQHYLLQALDGSLVQLVLCT